MIEPSRAVFLSYASQDAEAAQRICEALRAAGVEVWFDQSELRGGDTWDRKIRRQIHDCALFVPVISANTQARLEGYFRLEWRLAVERTHLMADAKPFLVPAVVDSTNEQVAEVPDAFRAVQWTRLPAGETPPAFVERIGRLLSGDTVSSSAGSAGVRAAPAPHRLIRRPAGVLYGVIAAMLLLALGYFVLERLTGSKRYAQTAASIAVLPLANESERPPSGSLEAYNALLRGKLNDDSRHTEADTRKAIESYTAAITLDPRYALAWSALSRAWGRLGAEYRDGFWAQEPYAKAREAADRALSLSPDLAAAHLSRGLLLQFADFDWYGAEAEFRRAMALAPNDGEAKFYLGTQLATFGKMGPAIELTQQALTTEPPRAIWYVWLASYFSGLNRLDDAEQAIRKAIELQPGATYSPWMLTTIEVQRGHAQAALAAAQQEPDRESQAGLLALALQIGGDRRTADAALRAMIKEDANGSAYRIAQVYALRNDAKSTFEWLDRTWSNREWRLRLLLYDPFIQRYTEDPRFAAFCRKVGLPVPGETSSRKST